MLIDHNTKNKKLKEIITKFEPRYIFLGKKINNCLINNYEKIENNFLNNVYEIRKHISYEIDKSLFLLLSTSGSTGSSKFTKLTKKNILTNTKDIIDYLALNEKDCTLTNLPINYAYGLSVINSHLRASATLILTEKSIIEKPLVDMIRKNKITNFNGVPSTYDLMFNFKLEDTYLKNTRFISQAGGGLKKKTFDSIFKYLNKKSKDFFIMYGQTEAAPRMSYHLVREKKYRSGIIGKPIESGKFILKDGKKNIIYSPYKIGNLFYKGPNIFSGYAKNKLQLKKLKKIETLDTGDIAEFDNRGDFYIKGRANRYVKIEDKRISLDELENLISGRNYDIVCTFKNDKIIVWYNKKKLDIDKIYNKIKQNTSFVKKHFIFRFIDYFPKNSSGKVLFKELNYK